MKVSLILALIASCLLTSGFASATHKAWLLKSGGAECQFQFPSATDHLDVDGSLYNDSTGTRTVNCPLTLASRWGSNGIVHFASNEYPWVDARSAIVYLQRRGAGVRSVSCNAVMETTSGSRYYSATRSDTGDEGIVRIDLASQLSGSAQWASDSSSTLEQNEALYALSLAFSCFVPSDTAVLGTKAKLCQYQPDCFHALVDPEVAESGGDGISGNYVQTSGIECSPVSAPGSDIVRGYDGITNNGTSSLDVFCPITPPADDTDENIRRVRLTSVRYTSGSNASNCVAAGTCPSCSMVWYGRDGVLHSSAPFPKDPAGSRTLLQPGLDIYNVGQEVQFGVMCHLPGGGTTIEGLTSLVTVTFIHGGT
ncbi:hypothetical protein WMF30_30305 [Sorangium sp. So ce134]